MAGRKLLFFTDEMCSGKTAAAATLAWLAVERGYEFDGYIAVKD